ncbi:uncharacterized protein LOC117648983, partial [Thrips palmi]|uniref:Uncharacterized protein LOC117648983 n=1 Tax=Thrips palmi TaxID=161013 RepID=A0A6P8Z463_THRPL
MGTATATSDSGSSGKVLNFFPVPVSDECLSNDGRRTGICLNTYECRIQNGKSYGPCALGFGVCCVFTASCGDVVENNVTYFVSPNFPAITREASSCELEVKKMGPEVSQLRLDFVHFNMGQPNRRTGVCESDTFVIAAGTNREFSVCGQNSGQHIYFDVEDMDEPITILMNMSREHTARLWEIKVTQIEFQQRVPSGCLQYHRDGKGVIQTMNFAENGRHLANQDYTICMRQEEDMCSIVYEPCDENSFKIGPAVSQQQLDDEVGGSGFGIVGEAREQCNDKIVMPCDSEEFLAAEGFGSTGLCD